MSAEYQGAYCMLLTKSQILWGIMETVYPKVNLLAETILKLSKQALSILIMTFPLKVKKFFSCF